MTFDQLQHAIRAACGVTEDTEVIVFGSQAILGSFPNAHHELRQSIEADVVPKNFPDRADLIDGSLGELSQFHHTHGFYVHGLQIEAAKLPEGWANRTVKVETPATDGKIGWCIEGHDLAASKLVAFREKDREFVRVLMRENYVDSNMLKTRIQELPVNDECRARLLKWVDLTHIDLDRSKT